MIERFGDTNTKMKFYLLSTYVGIANNKKIIRKTNVLQTENLHKDAITNLSKLILDIIC